MTLKETIATLTQLVNLDDLEERAEFVVSCLDDPNEELRCAALSALGRMDLAAIAEHAQAIAGRLQDRQWRVRNGALGALSQLRAEELSTYVEQVGACLEDECRWVRLSALEALACLDPVTVAPCASAVVRRLDDDNLTVRPKALEVLANMEAYVLAPHAATIATCLSDDSALVRQHALRALSNLDGDTLQPYAAAIEALLKDLRCSEKSQAIRILALSAPATLTHYAASVAEQLDVAGMDASIRVAAHDSLAGLEQYVHVFAQSLRDARSAVRFDALCALSMFSAMTLRPHVAAVVQCVSDQVESVRIAALNVLALLEQNILAPHEAVVVELVSAADSPGLRSAALQVLARLDAEVLARHWDVIASCLADARWSVRVCALMVVLRLNPTFMLEHRDVIAQCIEDKHERVRAAAVHVFGELDVSMLSSMQRCSLMHVATRGGALPVVHRLVTTFPAALINVRSQCDLNDTPLHIAARHGHGEVCAYLVAAGALVRAKNRQSRTPADEARCNGHVDVVALLESRHGLAITRVGMGDALEQALRDERPVSGVQWYTIALPGIVGDFGGCHSVLAVTVHALDMTTSTQPSAHTYCIEKAEVENPDAPGFLQNGLRISHWTDVAPNLDSDPIHILSGDALNGECDLRMSVLLDIAMGTGPYDVGSGNCHHAALAVYNHCAAGAARVHVMPNFVYTLGAKVLTQIDLNLPQSAHSEVISRGSRVASNSAPTAASAMLIPVLSLSESTPLFSGPLYPGLPPRPVDSVPSWHDDATPEHEFKVGAGSKSSSPQSRKAASRVRALAPPQHPPVAAQDAPQPLSEDSPRPPPSIAGGGWRCCQWPRWAEPKTRSWSAHNART